MRETWKTRAAELYRYAPLREAVYRWGPAYWRLPPDLRRRVVLERAIGKLWPESIVWAGEEQRVRLGSIGGRAPTLGHRIASRPYTVPPPIVAIIENVWLVGRFAVPVTSDGRVLLAPFRNQHWIMGRDDHEDLKAFLRDGTYRGRPADQTEMAFSSVSRLGPNYFHWMTETCGQFQYLEAAREALGMCPQVIIDMHGPSFQRPSLRLLGWDDNCLDRASTDGPIFVRRLVLTSIPGIRVAPSPSTLVWLRQRFLGAVGLTAEPTTSPSRTGEPVYIARRPGGWRSLVNYEEVEGTLEAEGIRIVRAEDLDLAEQIQTFHGANLIVGQHGAGLANVLFAPRASVVEIGGGYGGAEYYGMTSALGQSYELVTGVPHGEDLFVSPSELVRTIRRVHDAG